MKLIADANILFSLIIPSTSSSNLVKLHNIRLFSPSFALGELAKYRSEIEGKTKISFEKAKESLQQQITFINETEFSSSFKQFEKFVDPKDVSYLALSSYLHIPIWSNDLHFKQQSSNEVITTEELIELLEP